MNICALFLLFPAFSSYISLVQKTLVSDVPSVVAEDIHYDFSSEIDQLYCRQTLRLLPETFICYDETLNKSGLEFLDHINKHYEKREDNKRIHYNAFSHNDYSRENPLTDALSFRFNCVEADLYLINGELYVSHEPPDSLDNRRTFKELYLKPLVDRIRKNAGKIYPGSDRPFLLMVDCKTNGDEMYPVLKAQLEPYKDLFCLVEEGTFKEGAILFFLSGDRPMNSLPQETTRFTFLDGRISDLGKNIPYSLMPVVSDNFSSFFTWKGEGQMPADELKRMREIMTQAHKEGKLFRWWGAPDTENYKRFILKEGIDLIGADDLNSLFTILNEE